jgi:hypothetical protein
MVFDLHLVHHTTFGNDYHRGPGAFRTTADSHLTADTLRLGGSAAVNFGKAQNDP